MMHDLTVAATMMCAFLGIYKLFELFVCRKERLMTIEKLSPEALAEGGIKGLRLPASNMALRFGCLLMGLGLGLLVGYMITRLSLPEFYAEETQRTVWETASIIYGASVLLGGGLGLLVAFWVEVWREKRTK